MLPVTSGFIFPNGFTLESNGSGHRKAAAAFIRERGLREKFDEYEKKTHGGEDEFLIDVIGALKVCHYSGVHYLYVPRVHNEYIEYIAQKYDAEGYQIKINYSDMVLNINKFFKKLTSDGYNKTVITRKDSRGASYYIYNPNREGD